MEIFRGAPWEIDIGHLQEEVNLVPLSSFFPTNLLREVKPLLKHGDTQTFINADPVLQSLPHLQVPG